jgi:hypothetical protein
VRLVIRDALAVVDAAVQREIEAEGQEAHAVSVMRWKASGQTVVR